jgi:aminoglycoside phosphotransferase (APT) family kinase protein
VAAPELVAFDETGDRCGAPATLTTMLPGRVVLAPSDFDAWLRGLAEPLPRIHAAPAAAFPWRYRPYYDVDSLRPPAWSAAPARWERALALARRPWPPAPDRFVHRDYHPANVLWRGRRASGVVDWVNACVGPAAVDVAWCRKNLALLHGVSAADRFLVACRDVLGPGFEHAPFWDVLAILEELPGPPNVYRGWLDFGVRGLSAALVESRVEEYLASVLARLEG